MHVTYVDSDRPSGKGTRRHGWSLIPLSWCPLHARMRNGYSVCPNSSQVSIPSRSLLEKGLERKEGYSREISACC